MRELLFLLLLERAGSAVSAIRIADIMADILRLQFIDHSLGQTAVVRVHSVPSENGDIGDTVATKKHSVPIGDGIPSNCRFASAKGTSWLTLAMGR